MKKLILFVAVCIFFGAGNVMAQEGEHLKFMGISMNLNVNTFVEKLKQKGFKYEDKTDDAIVLKGSFAGYSNCKIYVMPNNENKARIIGVSFDYADSWQVLYANYLDIKTMLMQKYGTPIKEIEEWTGYLEPKDDNSRMHEVRMNRCNYQCVFNSNGNVIMVAIANVKSFYSYVSLTYLDSINYNKGRERAIDDL